MAVAAVIWSMTGHRIVALAAVLAALPQGTPVPWPDPVAGQDRGQWAAVAILAMREIAT
jgi:hypothetical protein